MSRIVPYVKGHQSEIRQGLVSLHYVTATPSYPDMRDGYDGSFDLSLADLHFHSVLDLQPAFDSLTDALETMFHVRTSFLICFNQEQIITLQKELLFNSLFLRPLAL